MRYSAYLAVSTLKPLKSLPNPTLSDDIRHIIHRKLWWDLFGEKKNPINIGVLNELSKNFSGFGNDVVEDIVRYSAYPAVSTLKPLKFHPNLTLSGDFRNIIHRNVWWYLLGGKKSPTNLGVLDELSIKVASAPLRISNCDVVKRDCGPIIVFPSG